jgi:hypothetical protein
MTLFCNYQSGRCEFAHSPAGELPKGDGAVQYRVFEHHGNVVKSPRCNAMWSENAIMYTFYSVNLTFLSVLILLYSPDCCIDQGADYWESFSGKSETNE